MISPFTLHRPTTLDQALAVLCDHGEEARILAGGSELVLLLKMNLLNPGHLVDIKGVYGLDEIEFDPETEVLRVGGLVTHRMIETSGIVRERFPVLASVERQLANVRVRNVGTIGGNLCFAEPHADPGTLLMAYQAKVKTRSVRGERSIEIGDFFVDYYKTALKQDEILTEIEIPRLSENFKGTYLRYCPGERPTVNLALFVAWESGLCSDARLVLGCMDAKPIRGKEIEEDLRGKAADEITAKALEVGVKAAQLCDPLPDIWGSVEYKRQIVKTLVSRGLEQLCAEGADHE